LPFLLANQPEVINISGLQSLAKGSFKHIQLQTAPQLNQYGSLAAAAFAYYTNILEARLITVNLIVKTL